MKRHLHGAGAGASGGSDISENMEVWRMADEITDVDQLWILICRFLINCPNQAERQKAVRLLRRRLAHPEQSSSGTIPYNASLIEKENAIGWKHAKPPVGTNPCLRCGAPLAVHDPMTGERNACEGFVPTPN